MNNLKDINQDRWHRKMDGHECMSKAEVRRVIHAAKAQGVKIKADGTTIRVPAVNAENA